MSKLFKMKNRKIILLITVSVLFTGCFLFRLPTEDTVSFPVNDETPRMSENDFDITAYQPFRKESKVVSLDTVSTLKLEKKLPILDGATALYPLYSAFVQAVYPENSYDIRKSKVMCNNTMTAYKSLINKTVDIIFVAYPSKEQIEMAEKMGVTLKFTPIGKEAFVFFVNKNNPINDLTVNEIQDIYSGKIKNWNEIGGTTDSIIPFQRNTGSGSQSAFVRFMEGKEIIEAKTDERIYGMFGIITRVANYANYPNSIGFSFRFFTNEMVNNQQIKLLKINGIYPNTESIKNKSYPLTSDFYAVTLQDNKNPNVEKLLEWIKSEQGQKLVEKTGYTVEVTVQKIEN
jgi:phosphate transport system substrate-binding protein